MIRNIVVVKVKPNTSHCQIQDIAKALDKLKPTGRLASALHCDLGLREGNMDFAIIADFRDAATYQSYDILPEHQRIRTEMVAPIALQVDRIQIAI